MDVLLSVDETLLKQATANVSPIRCHGGHP